MNGSTIGLGSFAVDPRSSILFANIAPMHPDNPMGPIFIDLDKLAQTNHLGPTLTGYRLDLRAVGSMCYILLENGCPSVPTEGFVASFDVNSIFVRGAINPLPGAIAPISPVESAYPRTFYDQLPTDGGPPDFRIYRSAILMALVPDGAHFLAVGVFDSFFADNSGNVSLEIQLELPDQPVPEPTPLVMSILGFSLIFAGSVRLRRLEKSRAAVPRAPAGL